MIFSVHPSLLGKYVPPPEAASPELASCEILPAEGQGIYSVIRMTPEGDLDLDTVSAPDATDLARDLAAAGYVLSEPFIQSSHAQSMSSIAAASDEDMLLRIKGRGGKLPVKVDPLKESRWKDVTDPGKVFALGSAQVEDPFSNILTPEELERKVEAIEAVAADEETAFGSSVDEDSILTPLPETRVADLSAGSLSIDDVDWDNLDEPTPVSPKKKLTR